MASEEDIYCSKCNNKTEQALMLSCDHNLCLSCASKTLNKQQIKDINTSQYIKCDICNNLTELEPETIKQIIFGGNDNNQNNEENYVIDNLDSNYFLDLEENNNNNNINQHFKNIISNSSIPGNQDINNKINQYNNNQKNNGDNNNITSSEINIINDLINNNKNKCKEHGELLSYLCLDCMSNCVCSECVVHGIHRNHEVLNIKKAYPLIYNKTQEIGNLIGNRIKELNTAQNNIEQKKKDINFLNNKCKIDIRQAFDELRSLLNRKEKEIITKTENTLNDNLNELNTYSHLIQSKILLLNKLIETVNAYLMRKDELTLINFYTENKNKILAQSEINELNNINNINIEGMANLRVDIDKSSFDAMISAINTLNFEINTFKGIDFGNQYNLGKFTANRNLYGNNFINDNNNIIGINEVNVTETVNSLNEKK